MEIIRNYVLEYDIPIEDPRYAFAPPDDEEWIEKKGVINKENLGDYISRYLNTIYVIFSGVILWLRNKENQDPKKIKAVTSVLSRNLFNYEKPASLMKISSELRRLGVTYGEDPDALIHEAAAGTLNFFKYAKRVGIVIGLATAFGALITQFDYLKKARNIFRNDRATKLKSGIIFEGTILPRLRDLFKKITSRSIKDNNRLKSEIYKIQDIIIKNSPHLTQYVAVKLEDN